MITANALLSYNYHFMIDDKFIDDFIKVADEVSKNNIYIFNFGQPAKYVKSTNGIFISYDLIKLKKIISQISESDKIFIHWYDQNLASELKLLKTNPKIYLMFWGGDFLETPLNFDLNNKLSKNNYEPNTIKYLKENLFKNYRNNYLKNYNLIQKIKIYIREKYLRLDCILKYRKQIKERKLFLLSIYGICHWNYYDVNFLNKFYGVKLKHYDFSYGVGIADKIISPKNDTNHILKIFLGNSDTETNNHLDSFELLNKFKHHNFEIICPLNYGNITYANFIAKIGEEKFGEKFKPILNFMPRKDYYELMDSVDICIMNNVRNQGAGNIVNFLKNGVKVFLNNKSTILV